MLLYMILSIISNIFGVVRSFLLVVGSCGLLNGFVYCYIDSIIPVLNEMYKTKTTLVWIMFIEWTKK